MLENVLNNKLLHFMDLLVNSHYKCFALVVNKVGWFMGCMPFCERNQQS